MHACARSRCDFNIANIVDSPAYSIAGHSDRLCAVRIFMQTRPASKEAPRYYHLILQQDLLGGWTLIREWGQQGGRASSKREVFLERDAALVAFEHARDAQIKRGFRVMFSQGIQGAGD